VKTIIIFLATIVVDINQRFKLVFYWYIGHIVVCNTSKSMDRSYMYNMV
jgi:hypothetical protein